MVSKEQAISAAKLIDSLYYYTPSIEDIHVGYECEIYNANSEWFPITITLGHIFNDLLFYTRDISKELTNLFRTPYLTKEQIEAEGWENYNSKLKPLCFKKDDYHLYFYEEDYTITIGKGTPPMWLNYYYNGKCPSINEFRKIVKLLGIVK